MLSTSVPVTAVHCSLCVPACVCVCVCACVCVCVRARVCVCLWFYDEAICVNSFQFRSHLHLASMRVFACLCSSGICIMRGSRKFCQRGSKYDVF